MLLGSATPALESFYNVRRANTFYAAPNRVDNRSMPDMRIVDMREERNAKDA